MISDLGRRRTLVVAAAVLLLIAVVVVVLSGGDRTRPPTTGASPSAVAPTEQPDHFADVAPVACGGLLTAEDREVALGILERPAGERDSIGSARGETCSERLAVDESHFVRIEPGSPSDFEPGAILAGASGSPVPGVGDDALWFVGTQESDGFAVGILGVRKLADVGTLHFRIVLGRPDLDDQAHLDLAKSLALRALPRFPGIHVERPEPSPVRFARDDPDRTGASYVDNLNVREAAGEWTRGEGLVAILNGFAGEGEAQPLLDDSRSLVDSGTGMLDLARDYVDTGPDPVLRAEVARLLDILELTPDELEALLAATAPSTARTASLSTLTAQELPCEPNCMVKLTSDVLDDQWPGKYQLLRPLGTTSGWSRSKEDAALEAMVKAALVYESLGTMPRVYITFWSDPDPYSSTTHAEKGCVIKLNSPMKTMQRAHFQQRIARDMAYCLLRTTYPDQDTVQAELSAWWREGVAMYLSDVVFPDADFELRYGPAWLAAEELETSLLERQHTNWAFFEHVGAAGPKGALALIPRLARNGENQADRLVGARIDDTFHAFARELTDGRLSDASAKVARYAPRFDQVTASGPILVLEEPKQFGLARLHVKVPAGKAACVDVRLQGETRLSWRTGKAPTPRGTWTDVLPDRLTGDSVFIVTATSRGATLELEVTDVDTGPDCGDESPEPTVDPTDCGLCGRSLYFFDMVRAN